MKEHIDTIGKFAVTLNRIIIEKEEQVFRFAHDIIKQNVYDMMPLQEQNNSHLSTNTNLLPTQTSYKYPIPDQLCSLALFNISQEKILGNLPLCYSDWYVDFYQKMAESSLSVSHFISAFLYSEHSTFFSTDHPRDDYKISIHLYDTTFFIRVCPYSDYILMMKTPMISIPHCIQSCLILLNA
jgi:hypothetical protein